MNISSRAAMAAILAMGVHGGMPARAARPLQPIPKKQPKFGRNQPCPCGSGKKYKKCHGGRHG